MKTAKKIDKLNEKSLARISPLVTPLITHWRRPKLVKVEDDQLVYSIRNRKVLQDANQPFEPLKSFLKLAYIEIGEKAEQKIIKFAERWGVLGICREHLLPWSHNDQPTFSDNTLLQLHFRNDRRSCGMPERNGDWSEPLSEWYLWLRLAKAIFSLGLELHQGRNGKAEHWNFMGYKPAYYAGIGKINRSTGLPEPELGKTIVASYVTSWLEVTGVKPRFEWLTTGRIFSLGVSAPDRLLSILGVQIMMLINRSSGLGICTSCGEWFLLRTRQSLSRNVYCEHCGKKAARRDAQARYYKRKKQLIKTGLD